MRSNESTRIILPRNKRASALRDVTRQGRRAKRRRLAALAALPGEAIDTSDIPEALDFDDAVRGRFFRPVKQSVTIRLDADVLDFLRKDGPRYQSRINAILRDYMTMRGKTPPP